MEESEEEVQRVVEWCKKGPPRAKVEKVKVEEGKTEGVKMEELKREEGKYNGEFGKFEIL